MTNVPFNVPYVGRETAAYIEEALKRRSHCGNRIFAERCIELMKERYGFGEVFLVPSESAALEMGVLLADLQPGDEVLLPSYASSAAANAVVLRGARPVFCEVEEATLNLDVADVEGRMTTRTRMILPLDYAGHSCRLNELGALCAERGLVLLLNGSQSLHSRTQGQWAGSFADMTAFSFHETKSVSCGEGGALVVNRPDWVQRATFAQEKGTDRSLVLKGVRDKYRWVHAGSSFLLADPLAAMLLAQLEEVDAITERRALVTGAYARAFAPFEDRGLLRLLPSPPDEGWNHHAFVVVFASAALQGEFLRRMRQEGVDAHSGHTPLHASPMGHSLGYRPEDLPRTLGLASRVVRMPLFNELEGDLLAHVLEATGRILAHL